MADIVSIHRLSARLPDIGSGGSEPLSPRQDDRLQARLSEPLPGVQDLRLESRGQRANSIGKPVQLTLPLPLALATPRRRPSVPTR
jgi:hypothetical protein